MAKYYKVWEIKDENNIAEVRLSRSRKVKDNDYDKALEKAGVAKKGYVTDFSDSYVRFVGKAYNQLKKYEIQSGDTILAEIDITNEAYIDKNGEVAYPKGYRHTVYEFELPESTSSTAAPKNIDKAPKVSDAPASATKVVPYEEPEEIEDEEEPF